ncbi:MAG: metal-dependent hydrolase, partial [Coleofasciculus sp. B1-GNL1-01]|uniref:metal-dependent hydrolase n=1 Tax=Coleofasciculus sp. B1-GNL1-01 TaxID=3068484 RepID=UPI0032FBF586
VTHAVISAAATSLILQSADPVVLGTAVLTSQLPDIDTTDSAIGSMFFPLAQWIERRFPHRSITHSLLATGGIALLSYLSWLVFGGFSWKVAIAIPLGHLIACFSDTFTKQGVQLFFPEPAWCVCGSNPRRRLRTGGHGEYWVMAFSVLCLVVSLHISGTGGIVQKATTSLGLKDPSIMQTYNQNAANHRIWAEVEGYRASDRSPVSGRFLVVGEDSGFILTDGTKVHHVGKSLITSSLKLEVGKPVTVTTQQLTFDDEEVNPKLKTVTGEAYLNGSVDIDMPETVTAAGEMLTLNGSKVTLNYCPVSLAMQALENQWAIGALEVKTYE